MNHFRNVESHSVIKL